MMLCVCMWARTCAACACVCAVRGARARTHTLWRKGFLDMSLRLITPCNNMCAHVALLSSCSLMSCSDSPAGPITRGDNVPTERATYFTPPIMRCGLQKLFTTL